MVKQHTDDTAADGDLAVVLALGARDVTTLPAATLGVRPAASLAADVDELAVLVDVIDLDGESLADAKPAADQKLGQGPVLDRAGLQIHRDFGRAQPVGLEQILGQRIHLARRASQQQLAIVDQPCEERLQHAQRVVDRLRCELVLLVELSQPVLHVGLGDGRDLLIAEVRDQPQSPVALVVLVGARHEVGPPRAQVVGPQRLERAARLRGRARRGVLGLLVARCRARGGEAALGGAVGELRVVALLLLVVAWADRVGVDAIGQRVVGDRPSCHPPSS